MAFKRSGIFWGWCLALAAAMLACPVVARGQTAEPVYDEHGQRDPFLPLVTAIGAIMMYDANVAVTEMALEGIVSDEKGGLAIINGNVFALGQHVGAYTITAIGADHVDLVKAGQVAVLHLKKEE